jgi:hypothetical protein
VQKRRIVGRGKRKKRCSAVREKKKSLDPPNRIAALLTVGLSLSFYFIVAFPFFCYPFLFFCFDNVLFSFNLAIQQGGTIVGGVSQFGARGSG